jgi:predicted acetyltransferase
MAVDNAARALLFSYLFDQDLMGQVHLSNVPEDDPLMFWLDNLRATKPRWLDALYLRLVDLPVALRSRTYQAPLDVVLDVSDPVCPWNAGRWALVAGGDQVTCEGTDRPADLALSVTELGAAYLGGTSLTDLAAAGRIVVHSPPALTAANLAFQSTLAPWCPVVF